MTKLNPSEIEFEKKNNEILTKQIYVLLQNIISSSNINYIFFETFF